MVAGISSARFADFVAGCRIWRCGVCLKLVVLLVSLLLDLVDCGICGVFLCVVIVGGFGMFEVDCWFGVWDFGNLFNSVGVVLVLVVLV